MFGANPLINVIKGFIRRVWGNLGVDKVALVSHGVFIVRFNAMDIRDKVINGPRLFFDKKPVFMKPWAPDMVLGKRR